MGSSSVLSGLLSGASWEGVTDYLSPAVLDIVSPRALSSELMQLSSNFIRTRRWRARRDAIAKTLSPAFDGLIVSDTLDGATSTLAPLSDEAKEARGNKLLELYFYQIESQRSALLDLRSGSFMGSDSLRAWAPAPLYSEWSPEFIGGIRKLYRGFYLDQPDVYQAALITLHLGAADEIFRAHFGTGDQSSVTFSLAHFRNTFHETFLVCKREGIRLSSEFVSLGLMLACLYEHLEKLGGAYNVRRAYSCALARGTP